MGKFRLAFAGFVALACSSAIAQNAGKITEGGNGTVGIAFKASTLGPGAEMAVRVTKKLNLRAGANAFSYSADFDQDGINYTGNLQMRSAEAHLDFSPWAKSFHISPGVLIYNGNQITAKALVPGGQTFTLDDVDYKSDPANPMTGDAKIKFNEAAPMFTFGWGNIVPRSGKHWSVPFEMGVAFMGTPKATLSFKGGACDPVSGICQDASSDPQVLANVQAEQKKLNDKMEPFKAYPVISLGVSYKF